MLVNGKMMIAAAEIVNNLGNLDDIAEVKLKGLSGVMVLFVYFSYSGKRYEWNEKTESFEFKYNFEIEG